MFAPRLIQLSRAILATYQQIRLRFLPLVSLRPCICLLRVSDFLTPIWMWARFLYHIDAGNYYDTEIDQLIEVFHTDLKKGLATVDVKHRQVL